jgi:hypothetical protein
MLNFVDASQKVKTSNKSRPEHWMSLKKLLPGLVCVHEPRVGQSVHCHQVPNFILVPYVRNPKTLESRTGTALSGLVGQDGSCGQALS